MDGFDTRRVLEQAINTLNSPKGWLIVTGSVVGMCVLSKKGLLKMDGFDQRRVLEQLIDKMGDSK